MNNLEIVDAIKYLAPEAEFSFQETDLSTLEWHSENIKRPTDKEIIAAVDTVKKAKEAELEAKAAAREALLNRLGITEDEAKLLLS